MNTARRFFLPALILGIGALLLPACEEEGNQVLDPNGDVVEISLTQVNTFEPGEVTIAPGTTVRWINAAPIFHTITPDGHEEWLRATLDDTGDTFEHTFEEAGIFPYFCEVHENVGMTGTITVQ